MQLVDLKTIELSESMVLVDIDSTEYDLIHEGNNEKHRNRGRIISIAKDVANCKIGDMVHFSDIAGIFPFKKIDRNKITLHCKELLFISEDPKIFVGEDLTFYLTDLNAAASFGRRASI